MLLDSYDSLLNTLKRVGSIKVNEDHSTFLLSLLNTQLETVTKELQQSQSAMIEKDVKVREMQESILEAHQFVDKTLQAD